MSAALRSQESERRNSPLLWVFNGEKKWNCSSAGEEIQCTDKEASRTRRAKTSSARRRTQMAQFLSSLSHAPASAMWRRECRRKASSSSPLAHLLQLYSNASVPPAALAGVPGQSALDTNAATPAAIKSNRKTASIHFKRIKKKHFDEIKLKAL